MRLRQVALAAGELEPAVDALCGALGVTVAHRDPGVKTFGLENAVMPVSDAFLEVVSPIEEGTSAGRFLERRGGDSGYMVMVQTGNLAPHRERLEAAGVRAVWSIELPDMEEIHLHPRDVGGAILSLSVPRPPESWRWAGPEWESVAAAAAAGAATALLGVELEAADPAAMAQRWSAVLGRSAEEEGGGCWAIALDAGGIRFAPLPDDGSRGEGLVAVHLGAPDPDRLLDGARQRGLHVSVDGVRVAGTLLRLFPI